MGLGFSYYHIHLPSVIESACGIVAQSASFIALFALGLSFGSPKVGLDKVKGSEISTIVVLKTILHPAVAFLIGRYVFGLMGFTLTAVTLMAAMPTAKNLFVFSERYKVGKERANIIILTTTIMSVAMLTAILYISKVW